MIIDANDLIIGRLASYVAKQALLGEKIEIVNAKESIIVGDKNVIFAKYKQKIDRGNPHHGPNFPISPDKILRRTIRNMLPHRQYKGLKAFKNIMCHAGLPDSVKKEDAISIENAKIKSGTLKYIKLKDLVYLLRQKK